MATKIYIREVKSCNYCPARKMWNTKYYCSVAENENIIEDTSIIPTFCPLEDLKENEYD